MTTTPAPEPDLLPQCLQRQLDELEAIELIYPPPPAPSTDPGEGGGAPASESVRVAAKPRDLVRRALEEDRGLLQLWGLLGEGNVEENEAEEPLAPLLSLTVGRAPCPVLEVRLPPLYPERGHPPRLRWAEGANRGRAELAAALLRLSEVSEAHEEAGGEHVLEIVQAFVDQQRTDEEAAAATAVAAAEQGRRDAEGKEAEGPQVLLRALIFFHHIINATKRDVVQREAVAHGLGGYSKYGWPGVVVVEGEEAAVRSYVRLLSTLRWQQMQVRGEERVVLADGQSLDGARRLHRGFLELGPNDLGKLMAALREAGLGELGATLMK